MSLSASASATFTGFISFGAPQMEEQDGLSFTEIGMFIPILGVFATCTVLCLGQVARVLNAKLVLLAGLAAMIHAEATLIWWAQDFFAMLCAWALYGVGYGVFLFIPYSQIAMMISDGDIPRKSKWLLGYDMCINVVGPGFGRVLMVICVSEYAERGEGLTSGWRLAMFAGLVAHCLCFVALVFQGELRDSASWRKWRFRLRLLKRARKKVKDQRQERAKSKGLTYRGKMKILYREPVTALLLFSLACLAFSFTSLSTWGPAFAHQKWVKDPETRAPGSGEDPIVVSGVLVGGGALTLPVGVAFTTMAVRRVSTLVGALRVAMVFMVLCVPSNLSILYARNFSEWIGGYFLFLCIGYFPVVFHKVLPQFLGLPRDVELVAMSHFTTAFTLFGNVLAPMTTAIVMDLYGVTQATWVLAFVTVVGVVLWAVPFVWSYMQASPVARMLARREEDCARREEAARVQAAGGDFFKGETSDAEADGEGAGAGSAPGGGVGEEYAPGAEPPTPAAEKALHQHMVETLVESPGTAIAMKNIVDGQGANVPPNATRVAAQAAEDQLGMKRMGSTVFHRVFGRKKKDVFDEGAAMRGGSGSPTSDVVKKDGTPKDRKRVMV
eukprot:g7815.t1